MASEEGIPVELYIYDLTHGLASVLSPAIIGHQVEGVWHTSVVVFEREFFYGGGGVTSCAPVTTADAVAPSAARGPAQATLVAGSTQLGPPLQTQRLGETFVPFQVFADYLQGLATTTYNGAAYHLLEHNCNHFSDEVVQFLCGAHCPKHILQQPEHLPAALRTALAALLDNLLPDAGQVRYADGVRHSRSDSPDFLTLNHQIEEARQQSAALEQRRTTLAEKVARKQRRQQRRQRRERRPDHPDPDYDHDEDEMSEAAAVQVEQEPARAGPSAGALAAEAEERRAEEARRRARDPPIVYRDIDSGAEVEEVEKLVGGGECPETRQALEELRQYLVCGEGSWVLGDEFLAVVGRVLGDAGGEAARAALLRALACAALRDDVSLLLHQDRRDHALMNYASQVEALSLPEQRALALFMCNLFEHISSSEWLLYISEWEFRGRPLSNIRATTKVAVHCALSEDAEVRERGTALVHNIATKERFRAGKALRDLLPRSAKSKVFDEVCVELGMAVLQVLGSAPGEELLFRSLKALARLAHHSHEVPQLVALVGPDPAAFRGTSPRVDEQIDLIMVKAK